jgi:hypothetical protein
MKLSTITDIQKQCRKIFDPEDKLGGIHYSGNMVAFYDLLERINEHFKHVVEGSIGFYTDLDAKYFSLFENYLNLFCEPVKAQFKCIWTPDEVHKRTLLSVTIVSLNPLKTLRKK